MEPTDTIAATGPFVSLTLPIEADAADAEDRMGIRWSNARRQLAEDGAPEDLLDRIEPIVTGAARQHAAAIHLVAPSDGPVLVHLGHDDDVTEQARTGPVPALLPLMRARDEDVAHLVVVVDREGADIWVRDSRGDTTGQDPDAEVDGDTEHIHRGQPGGWSQRRFQQRAENTWEKNAAGVAAEVDQVARRAGARLVVATGDVRALGFLEEHLSEETKGILTVVDTGGRSDDDAVERASAEADRLVADLAARRTVDALERFGAATGEDLAVEGASDTLRTLSEGRVAVLLVHDHGAEERTAFASVDGSVAATERSVIEDLGLEVVEGRLVDVAVRTALATGAEVVVVPAHGARVPREGIGGVLRG
ncbi:baeRF2 domain-containing protein [Actinomarinicola tropica]|uniref:Peptide chain release factor 2 n=1 Tax=Actinomarinicola tropica TaxID=2789776 RepID=A0A5Q2RH49_9ACTN|nr:Vms1/Ankzf1 family peptidyl-tRNA hydrolase [Actinomarinicola tropica]QGG96159.1 hypothetical protein GH723_14200 [Actinomarinicola tropica]